MIISEGVQHLESPYAFFLCNGQANNDFHVVVSSGDVFVQPKTQATSMHAP
jgi:hypothetical protein